MGLVIMLVTFEKGCNLLSSWRLYVAPRTKRMIMCIPMFMSMLTWNLYSISCEFETQRIPCISQIVIERKLCKQCGIGRYNCRQWGWVARFWYILLVFAWWRMLIPPSLWSDGVVYCIYRNIFINKGMISSTYPLIDHAVWRLALNSSPGEGVESWHKNE